MSFCRKSATRPGVASRRRELPFLSPGPWPLGAHWKQDVEKKKGAKLALTAFPHVVDDIVVQLQEIFPACSARQAQIAARLANGDVNLAAGWLASRGGDDRGDSDEEPAADIAPPAAAPAAARAPRVEVRSFLRGNGGGGGDDADAEGAEDADGAAAHRRRAQRRSRPRRGRGRAHDRPARPRAATHDSNGRNGGTGASPSQGDDNVVTAVPPLPVPLPVPPARLGDGEDAEAECSLTAPEPRPEPKREESAASKMFIVGQPYDFRTVKGKWVHAEVVRKVQRGGSDHIVFAFQDEDGGRDRTERIDLLKENARVAPLNRYTFGNAAALWPVGSEVRVRPLLAPIEFVQGTVAQVQGPQLEVEYQLNGNEFRSWRHPDLDEVRLPENNDSSASIVLAQYNYISDSQQQLDDINIERVMELERNHILMQERAAREACDVRLRHYSDMLEAPELLEMIQSAESHCKAWLLTQFALSRLSGDFVESLRPRGCEDVRRVLVEDLLAVRRRWTDVHACTAAGRAKIAGVGSAGPDMAIIGDSVAVESFKTVERLICCPSIELNPALKVVDDVDPSSSEAVEEFSIAARYAPIESNTVAMDCVISLFNHDPFHFHLTPEVTDIRCVCDIQVSLNDQDDDHLRLASAPSWPLPTNVGDFVIQVPMDRELAASNGDHLMVVSAAPDFLLVRKRDDKWDIVLVEDCPYSARFYTS